MTQSLSAEEIAELQRAWGESQVANECSEELAEMLDDRFPALLAMASRLVELEGAIAFLNERGVWQNTRPAVIVQTAKDYGWPGPTTPKKGG